VATGESQLVERAAHGDQEAFRLLWEAHHAVAMAAALRLCHRHALAEEITQGAFLLAWRGLTHFHTGSPFRPWLMRILYRHALDVMERQRVHLQPISLDEIARADQLLPGAQGSAAALEEAVVERERMRCALAKLSADQRRVIALRYGADLTEIEIAQILGWPVGTVKSRLSRARDRLRELLMEHRG
jgi:RNA polymerase sigma factor (sigma-70 family)